MLRPESDRRWQGSGCLDLNKQLTRRTRCPVEKKLVEAEQNILERQRSNKVQMTAGIKHLVGGCSDDQMAASCNLHHDRLHLVIVTLGLAATREYPSGVSDTPIRAHSPDHKPQMVGRTESCNQCLLETVS